MSKRRWILAGGVSVILIACILAYGLDLFPLPELDDGDFPLHGVSVFTEDSRSGLQYLARGEHARWHAGPDEEVFWVSEDTHWKTAPHEEVKAYPKLRSSRPLYGAIDLAPGRIWPDREAKRHFVADESAGTGRGYDRLYFDANGDLDLTNDPPAAPMESPPAPSHRYSHWGENTVFAPVSIPMDYGPGVGTRPFEILPRLDIEDGRVSMFFVNPEARKGTIRMGRRRFGALIAQSENLTGRYDTPAADCYLLTSGFRRDPLVQRWWGDERLASFRLVDGTFYTLSVTPTGDTLKVRRYRGDLGLVQLTPGGGTISEAEMSGSLRSASTTVPVGRLPYATGRLEKVKECQVPVGDYLPEQLRFRYGRLTFWLTDNYHVDGGKRGAIGNPPVYAIRVRKDRPFAFDFSNRPEVLFASPARDQTLKPGDELTVAAVLIDPVLNTMIRGLDDTTRKQSRKFGDRTIEQDLSLDPTVTVSDASGRKVAEGTMPFG